MKKYLEVEERWQLSVFEFISCQIFEQALRASREVLIDLFPVVGNNSQSLRCGETFPFGFETSGLLLLALFLSTKHFPE
jgi:hypothetical protein